MAAKKTSTQRLASVEETSVPEVEQEKDKDKDKDKDPNETLATVAAYIARWPNSRKWNSGREREILLRDAGYDPVEVRKEVAKARVDQLVQS